MGESYEQLVGKRRETLGELERQSIGLFEHTHGFAMQIVELRERRGLTQSQLAEKCGMDQAEISRVERGSTSLTTRVLQRIADALDADLKLVARAS